MIGLARLAVAIAARGVDSHQSFGGLMGGAADVSVPRNLDEVNDLPG